MIIPAPGEPAIAVWDTWSVEQLATNLVRHLGSGRRVLAVDGRSAGGKSTLARRLADQIAESAVVSADDVAWHESMFGWSDLLVSGVLQPFCAGSLVRFRPPARDTHDRSGAIEVAPSVRMLIVEGVGAARIELTDWLDASIWVQSDSAVAERRGIARDIASGVNGSAEETIAFWHAWQAEELPFLERDRPWDRADLIVAGTSAIAPGDGDIAVGRWQHGAT